MCIRDRALLLAGMALAVAGLIMQMLVRNQMCIRDSAWPAGLVEVV